MIYWNTICQKLIRAVILKILACHFGNIWLTFYESVNLALVVDRQRPFLCGFKRGQIQRLQKRCVAGKYAALAVQPTARQIQSFNGIGGIDYRPHFIGECEDGADSVPVVVPALHGSGVFLLPFLRDIIQRFSAFLLSMPPMIYCLITEDLGFHLLQSFLHRLELNQKAVGLEMSKRLAVT